MPPKGRTKANCEKFGFLGKLNTKRKNHSAIETKINELDSIIASSLTWNPGDIVVIDAPVTTSINKSDMDNRNVIIQALTALQNHTDVVMYFKEQLSRTYNPVLIKLINTIHLSGK